MPVDAFNDRSLSDRPPRAGTAPNTATPAPTLPNATGTPALAQRASGTENIRANAETYAAGSTRPDVAKGRSATPAQSFSDARV